MHDALHGLHVGLGIMGASCDFATMEAGTCKAVHCQLFSSLAFCPAAHDVVSWWAGRTPHSGGRNDGQGAPSVPLMCHVDRGSCSRRRMVRCSHRSGLQEKHTVKKLTESRQAANTVICEEHGWRCNVNAALPQFEHARTLESCSSPSIPASSAVHHCIAHRAFISFKNLSGKTGMFILESSTSTRSYVLWPALEAHSFGCACPERCPQPSQNKTRTLIHAQADCNSVVEVSACNRLATSPTACLL